MMAQPAYLTRILHLLLAGATAFASAACDPDDGETAPADACEGFATAYDSYVAGITKTGDNDLLSMRLVDAIPAPPNRGDNAWTVQLLDATSDAPASDVTMVDVTPFMPDHGHGPSTFPTHQCDGDGLCNVADIDFMMPGVWEVTFELLTADSQTDRVVFAFCIEG